MSGDITFPTRPRWITPGGKAIPSGTPGVRITPKSDPAAIMPNSVNPPLPPPPRTHDPRSAS